MIFSAAALLTRALFFAQKLLSPHELHVACQAAAAALLLSSGRFGSQGGEEEPSKGQCTHPHLGSWLPLAGWPQATW